MIRLCGIKKTYQSPDGTPVEALSGIDLNIDDGEIFGIIGLSGLRNPAQERFSSTDGTLRHCRPASCAWHGAK